MDKILVIIGAGLLIGFIAWWFFGKRSHTETEATQSDNRQEVEVTVNGGYLPNTIVLKKDVPATINFNRKDPSGCFEQVVFPDFGISENLPVNQIYPIEIDTSKPGEYKYACGMNMFFGKVVIK